MVEYYSSQAPWTCPEPEEEEAPFFEWPDYGVCSDSEGSNSRDYFEGPPENSGSGGITPATYIFNYLPPEWRLQHFLDNTVRKGSIYEFGPRPWHWDAGENKWAIDENKYGCQALASIFLAYWYNFNAHFDNLWRGFNNFEAFDRPASSFGVKDFVEERISLTYKELIAEGYLRRVNHLDPGGTPENNWYEFDPDKLNDINVFNEFGKHWGIYIKRGSHSTTTGWDVPKRDGSRNYIWRLAADAYLITNFDESGLDRNGVINDIGKFKETARNIASSLDQLTADLRDDLEEKIDDTCTKWEGYINTFDVSDSWVGVHIKDFPGKVNQGISELEALSSGELAHSQTAENIRKIVLSINKVYTWTIERQSNGKLRMWTNDPTTWRYMVKNLRAGDLDRLGDKVVVIWKMKDLLSNGWAPPGDYLMQSFSPAPIK